MLSPTVNTSDQSPLVRRVDCNGVALTVLELAPENKATATLVLHHGLRDSAYALLPIASMLSEHFHVLLPELRGHGQSDASDAYGVFDLVLDLHEVVATLAGTSPGCWLAIAAGNWTWTE